MKHSTILHELYFDSLGVEDEADIDLLNALIQDFGNLERWQSQFSAMGKGLGSDTGWVLLTYSH
jgi:superoxide dismutase, Fe-Mn family